MQFPWKHFTRRDDPGQEPQTTWRAVPGASRRLIGVIKRVLRPHEGAVPDGFTAKNGNVAVVPVTAERFEANSLLVR